MFDTALTSRPLKLGLALSAALLAACQGIRPAPADPQLVQAWQGQILNMLQRDMLAASGGSMVGAINLNITLDRLGRPIACSTQRAKHSFAQAISPDALLTDRKVLARAVEAQCWRSVYPLPPDALFEGDTLEVVAPLILMKPPYVSENEQARRQAAARQAFFWTALMREEPVASIGLAEIRYQTNPTGKVTGCLVTLNPHPLRRDAFRLDGELQARLTQRCNGLDLQQLPGFAPSTPGGLEGYTRVEYAPWKVGRN
ncbi:hypothetical protein ACQKPE_06360 [Pseudomonas sp. NPDC089554]|uniref:hypothetical protein n=1 Tax=Pseudomonas sp. NPDC089554 TaxID=3390653 RepID=UPI003D087E17